MKRTNLYIQKLILLTPFFFSTYTTLAQLQTIDATSNGPYTPQSLISNVFLGDGVDVLSVNYSGNARAVGYFSGGSQAIGIERGILMTSGYASKPTLGFGPTDLGQNFASNSNGSTATDANLGSIATSALRDVAVYTISFIPTADTLRFRYCFASEEYPEYSCTNFNDVFGFFIQGPGYPTPTNIAKIPGTNLPVSINNIHPYNDQNNPNPDPCFPFNSQYYNSNANTMQQPVYDGFTDVFTAMAVVQPCQAYTIKLAIADVFDSAYDSGVFLEARSFGTAALRVAVNTPGADGSIAEGCTPATVTFSLTQPLTQNFPINYSLLGNATQGVDFSNLTGNLNIPAGQTQLTVNVPALEDNQVEANETVGIRVRVDACHWDTVYLTIKDKLLVPSAMQDTTVCTPGAAITLNATVPIATPPPPVFSNNTDVAIPDEYPAINSSLNVTGVQPTKLGPGLIRSVCVNIAHPYDDDLDLFLISPGGQILELSTDNGGSGDNYTNTCFTPNAAIPINFPGPQAPASAAPFTGDFLPEGAWSDLWDTPNRPSNGAWQLQATDDFVSFSGTILDWSITFSPTYEVNYQWAAAGGVPCVDCPINSVNPLTSTTYNVTVTDIYGCTATDDVFVEVTDMTAAATTDDQVSCFGLSDGQVSASTNIGGTNTFLWNDPAGQTTAVATNLSPGTYTVTITNAAGCSATASASVTQPPLLDLTTTSQNANCFGSTTGTASVVGAGGTPPYTYLWNNGQTNANVTSLAAGNYVVTLTDSQGCTDFGQVNITQPNQIQVTALTSQVSCFNGANGQINLSVNGGISPINYNWSNGQAGAVINGLIAGVYTATVTDNNGCTETIVQTLTQPSELTAFATQQQVRCSGENNGELHLDLAGGTPGYSTFWQGPAGFTGNTPDIIDLFAGSYIATITDQNGCTKVVNSVVGEPSPIVLTLPAVADTICFLAENGTVSVIPSGGNGNFTYLWDAGAQTGSTASGLSANKYHVTVTDEKGCTVVGETLVPQKSQLNAFAQPTLPRCHDGSDGSATVTSIYYGIDPANPTGFTYRWNTTPTQFSVTASNLQANQTYQVTVSDADGCTATHSFTMGNPAEVEAQITGMGHVKCFGESTGWASANAFGGSAPYQWFWANSTTPTDSVGTGLRAGQNKVTITDAFGCPDVAIVVIEEPTQLIADIFPVNVKCFGETNGSARAGFNGGTPPYQYVWGNGIQNSDIRDLAAGEIRLTVTDANGCTEIKTDEIVQPETPVSGEVSLKEPLCFGDHNGQITITPAGGTPPYRYTLNNAPYNGSSIQIGLVAGDYVPKIKDNNGCITELTVVELSQPDPLVVDLGPNITILLGQDTQLLAVVTGDRGPYALSWSVEDSTWLSCMDCSNPSVYNLEYANFFEIRAIDSLGCRAEDQILVSVEKPRKVFVPTAFTPNGDFVNDLLLVHGQKTSKALNFRIYDRWGEIVYEAKDFAFNDETIGWDGTFRGQPMDPGVYVWVLEVEYVDGETEVYKGNTTLIR
ncbi:MAG: choice-of-anchor L domain-containing protein [Saprospiraceae bacterium]|nr:choice-of-anchor L domain-containing protein [Saprospiraceae bacterium]